MSSGAREPAGESDAPEQGSEEAAGPTTYPGAVVEAICVGCKEKRTQRVLERHVSRDVIEPGVGFEVPCPHCQGVTGHSVLEVYQEIEAPLGSVRTEISSY